MNHFPGFTGNIITNASTIKVALQELEAFAEVDSGLLSAHIADPTDAHDATAISVAAIVNLTATEAQGAFAEHQDDIDDLVVLSGVAANAVNLGTFTGTTIPDNSTNKAALQALETASESGSAALAAHIADPTDAHAGSAITNTPSGNLSATTVQGALNELQTDVDTRATTVALNAHINNVAGAHAATAISNTPAGTIAATTVQAAINELDGDNTTNASNLAAHLADAVDAHDASAISNIPSGNLSATDIQGAVNELQTDIDTNTSGLAAHIADTSTHGITSFILGSTETQNVSNKTISDSSIFNPLRLDVKKDTLANLVTYATSASNGQIVFATDTKEMYQIVDSALVAVGSGGGAGTADPDVLFAQDFDEATTGDFTQVGFVLNSTIPLHGAQSGMFFHDSVATLYAQQTITVDPKFRGVPITASINIKSTASDGNVTLVITDVTNSATLSTQNIQTDSQSIGSLTATSGSPTISGFTNSAINTLSIGMRVTGPDLAVGATISAINTTLNTITLSANSLTTGTVAFRFSALPKTVQLGFSIPANCSQISYRINALPQTSAETYVDDLQFKNYWLGTSTQGQSEYTFEVPTVTEWAAYTPTFTGFGTVSTQAMYWRQVGSSIQIRGSFLVGTSTATEARVSLPNSYLASSDIATVAYAGDFRIAAASQVTIGTVLMEPGVGYVTFSANYPVNANNPLVKVNGSTVTTSNTIHLNATLPITGLSATTENTVVTTDLVPAKAVLGNSTFEVPVLTDWVAYTPTFTGLGTVTNIESVWRRNGANIEIRSKFVTGTHSAVEPRISLPNNYSTSSSVASPSLAGDFISSVFSTTFFGFKALIEPSVSYITFGVQTSTNAATSKVSNASTQMSSSQTLSVLASVPISGLTATEEITVSGTQQLLTESSDSMIRLDTANGYGSTGTRVIRYTNIRQSLGSDILYTDSATAGGSFTVQTSGVYSISMTTTHNAATGSAAITKNASSLTTDPASLAISEILAIDLAGSGSTNNLSWQGYLAAGDIIRAQSNTAAFTGVNIFTMTKQGSVSVINTTSDQKITIPTSELRFEGSSSRGSTATGIVKFDSIGKIRGDAFVVTSDANNGTFVTMTKAGKIDINAVLRYDTATSNTIAISKNQAILTAAPTTAETLACTQVGTAAGANQLATVSYTGFVNVGDILRITSVVAPTADARSNFNLAFQEQRVAVSVSNVLPQFSESDSCIRVTSVNGYGSTATKIRRFSNLVQNIGTDVVYTDSATNGASFVTQTSGTYNVSYTDSFSGATQLGITLNQSSLTADVSSLTASEVLSTFTTSAASYEGTCSWQGFLPAGSIVRAAANGGGTGEANITSFTISKVGKPNVTGVNVTPFVSVPQPEISEIRMESANSRGAVATRIVRFDTTTKQIGSGISVTSDANNGTVFTVLKSGEINFTVSMLSSAVNQALFLTKNQSSLTSNPTQSEAMSTAQAYTTGAVFSVSYQGSVNVGDVFRVSSDNNPATSTFNNVNITLDSPSSNILTPIESFSTDTASLTYASSATYTMTTLANAPVGTFITYTCAINTTDTFTQTTTAPTQTTADMNANGIRIYTRGYSAASTAASPAVVAIQIGKGLKGLRLDGFTAVSKGGQAVSFDSITNGTANFIGFAQKEYNPTTGVLILDAAAVYNSSQTTHAFFTTGTGGNFSSATDAYFVINASKSPALAGVPLLQPQFATISHRAASGTSGTTSVATTWTTRTLNTLDNPAGIVTSLASNQFILPAGTYYLDGSYQAYNVGHNRARLQNITDGTTTLLGGNAYEVNTGNVMVLAPIKGYFTITSAKTFEIQHYAVTGVAAGFGTSSSIAGIDEVYALTTIQKVK